MVLNYKSADPGIFEGVGGLYYCNLLVVSSFKTRKPPTPLRNPFVLLLCDVFAHICVSLDILYFVVVHHS